MMLLKSSSKPNSSPAPFSLLKSKPARWVPWALQAAGRALVFSRSSGMDFFEQDAPRKCQQFSSSLLLEEYLAVLHAQHIPGAPSSAAFPVGGIKQASKNRPGHTPWRRSMMSSDLPNSFGAIWTAFTSQHCSYATSPKESGDERA